MTRKMQYEPIIGLEVHVELKTKSKMFCRCSADYFGNQPNTHTCPVCLGMPGALPVPNKKAIEWCVKIGLALNCTIPLLSKFDRKNYFYPDLAKGYQISQYDQPFCENGWIEVVTEDKQPKRIGIRRVHMEEDTGKLSHEGTSSLIDFNRSGVPLVEIVTQPDFRSAFEVKQYLQKLQQIVRYLGVSNADMEKGDMRLEPNISLRPCYPELDSGSPKNEIPGQARNDTGKLPKYKVEVKNINSFRFVEKAITYEVKRQQDLLEQGQTPLQETRGWDEGKQKTVSQRVKEEANDYRYFPEPDIPPIEWKEEDIAAIKASLPELPDEKCYRFQKAYGLSYYDAEILTRDSDVATYFEEAVSALHRIKNQEVRIKEKDIANFIINKKIDISSLLPEQLLEQVIASTAKDTIDEKELSDVVEKVLSQNPQAVQDYKNGKENVIMFLLGQAMRTLGKKVDPQLVKASILKAISN